MNDKVKLVYEYFKFAMVVLIVVCLGLLAMNQFIKYRFYNNVAVDPCGICLDANPVIKSCVYGQPNTGQPLMSTFQNFSFNLESDGGLNT